MILNTQRHIVACLLAFAICMLAVANSLGGLPEDVMHRDQIVGKPTRLVVEPPAIVLRGPRAMSQLLVSGHYGDGLVRDLTLFCNYSCESQSFVAADATGFLTPLQNGSGALLVKAGSMVARIPIEVTGLEKPAPVSFRHDLIAALNVGGCNQGACHGTPSGKNGFRLTLRGYDPAVDFVQLTRDVMGRRTDRLDPDGSLILQKALGRVPHEGGQRFLPGSVAASVLKQWLAEGLHDDPADLPRLDSIEVFPGTRILREPARWQQLAVLAHFSDGSTRDVTRLTVFSSSESTVAGVTASGLVEFQQAGEVAILCRYLDALRSVRLTYLQPRKGFKWVDVPPINYIDRAVLAKQKLLNILPAELCSDQEFMRRAFLDICGVVPSGSEARTFLASTARDKRTKLIDQLLDRPEYADFWTLKWSDVLRSNRKTLDMKGIYVFQDWLRDQLERDVPFDGMVRELLTASGDTFANPPANYYRVARDPQTLAETTAQLFFGIRMQCAKCHNHPFERWTQDDYYSMAAFFARVRQKAEAHGAAPPGVGSALVVYCDRTGEVMHPRSGRVVAPRFMGGSAAAIPAGEDRREVLARWVTSADNPFFAKATVNRIWFHMMGRGIVDPVDDFRDSNPSSNDELLDNLARDFAAHGFRVKHLIRVIANSRTYQLSAQTNEANKDDAKYFSHALTKLLSAEQLLDAICAATDVPEKYAGLPLGTRAAQLPDGDVNHVFLKTFGQPARELACECEREGDSNLAQALQLINGSTINEKMRQPDNRVGKFLAGKHRDHEILADLYLSSLSRWPAAGEVKAALDHVGRAKDKRKAWEDVQWALLNSKEFLFRH
jgi:hypothetical protein